jgi:hypothetical protein
MLSFLFAAAAAAVKEGFYDSYNTHNPPGSFLRIPPGLNASNYCLYDCRLRLRLQRRPNCGRHAPVLPNDWLWITISTKEYSLAQQDVFKLLKAGYMFQLYSHHQAYLQSLVQLYSICQMCTLCGIPVARQKMLQMELKTMGSHIEYTFNIYRSTSDFR